MRGFTPPTTSPALRRRGLGAVPVPRHRRVLLDARQALIGADLIAFEPSLSQVLFLDVDASAEPPLPRSATPRRLTEVLEQLRRPT